MSYFAALCYKSTLSCVIRETCKAIFEDLAGQYLHPPLWKGEWENIYRDFQETWNLFHAVGAIDDKHIRIQCPKQSRTLLHNYKGSFSFALLATCDSRYCFTLFDIGGKLKAGKMNIPPSRHLESCSFDPLPYYLVGD